jgi:hypothetical protein
MINSYEIRPRKHGCGVTLISQQLPFGFLWYGEPNAVENAASYAQFNTAAVPTVITIFDDNGAIIERRGLTPESTRPNTLGGL